MDRLTAWKLLDEADCHLTVARYVLMRADEGWQFIAYPQILLNPLHCWFLKLGDKETESPKGGEWVKPHSRLKGLKSCFWRNSEWNPKMESSVNNYRSLLIWKGLARCVAHTMASVMLREEYWRCGVKPEEWHFLVGWWICRDDIPLWLERSMYSSNV